MKLVMDGKAYVAVSSFAEREVPKAAGFRWDPNARRWWTGDAATAAKLAQYAEGELGETLRSSATAERQRAEALLQASHATDASGIDIPAPAGREYLTFQKAGIAYAGTRPAVLIGDEMGLGKTIQAIGIINADATIRRVLIVCPASLRINWEREFGRWHTRGLSIGVAISGRQWPETDVVVINYEILRKFPQVHATAWDALVVDECHYLKNPKTARTLAVVGGGRFKAQPINARRRIFLTGTPIPNRPIEAWPIVHFLAPKVFPNWRKFAERYCAAYDGRYGWDVSGASNLDELQEKLRTSIMVRRRKADVLKELPPKRRHVIEIPANGASGAIEAEMTAWAKHDAEMTRLQVEVELAKADDDQGEYERAVARLRDATRAAFAEISRLRHETALAKLPHVIEHVDDVVEQTGKVVVFAHHKDVVSGIADRFGDAAVVLTGDTSMADRQAAVDRFQSDETCKVFVGTIGAAGVGITLTASSTVVFAELDWVPGNVTQAEDRCHRIGQVDSVTVQHLVLDGSIDARMAHILVAKQAVIEQALDNHRELLDEPVLPELPPHVEKTPSPRTPRQTVVDVPASAAAAYAPKAQREIPINLNPATRGMVERQAEAIQNSIGASNIVEAIHRCLRYVAAMDDDRAQELNGVGFSKVDTMVGCNLAARERLTYRQAALGQHILRKYHRQIPEKMLTEAIEIS